MATVSTMIVFAPVAMMEGMGKYLFWPLAVAACWRWPRAMSSRGRFRHSAARSSCKPHGQAERFSIWLLILSAIVTLAGSAGMFLASTHAPESVVGSPRGLWSVIPPVTMTSGACVAVHRASSRLAPTFHRLVRAASRPLPDAVLEWTLRRRWIIGPPWPLFSFCRPSGPISTLVRNSFPEWIPGNSPSICRAVGGPRGGDRTDDAPRSSGSWRKRYPKKTWIWCSRMRDFRRAGRRSTRRITAPTRRSSRVQLRSGFAGRTRPHAVYVDQIRPRLAERLPDHTIFFESGGMIRRILNGGATAPIEVQVFGRDNVAQRARRLVNAEDRGLPSGSGYLSAAINGSAAGSRSMWTAQGRRSSG